MCFSNLACCFLIAFVLLIDLNPSSASLKNKKKTFLLCSPSEFFVDKNNNSMRLLHCLSREKKLTTLHNHREVHSPFPGVLLQTSTLSSQLYEHLAASCLCHSFSHINMRQGRDEYFLATKKAYCCWWLQTESLQMHLRYNKTSQCS